MRPMRDLKNMYVVNKNGKYFAYRTKKEYERDSAMHNQMSLKEFERK